LNKHISVTIEDLIKLRFTNRQSALFSGKKRNRKIFSPITGGYSSRFRGRGIDFQEVRAYQPGDDIRNMDWRVTARTGKPHIKLFEEEREKPVYIVIDNSASMHFGSRVTFKSVIAAKAAAILAWSTVANHDRVGGIVFSDDELRELRPQGGHRGALRFLKVISEIQCRSVSQTHGNSATQSYNNTSRFSDSIVHLRRVARPGSQIIILSDFHDLDDESIRHTALLSRHHEIVWAFIYDPLEMDPPQPGSYVIGDGSQLYALNTRNEDFNNKYRQRFQQKKKKISDTCRKYGLHFLMLATNDDIGKVLGQGFTEI